jgi:hypothetical protein
MKTREIHYHYIRRARGVSFSGLQRAQYPMLLKYDIKLA